VHVTYLKSMHVTAAARLGAAAGSPSMRRSTGYILTAALCEHIACMVLALLPRLPAATRWHAVHIAMADALRPGRRSRLALLWPEVRRVPR